VKRVKTYLQKTSYTAVTLITTCHGIFMTNRTTATFSLMPAILKPIPDT